MSPITTRNRYEQAQRGRWLFKITCVGGPCAGCPRICLSPLAILCWECRRRQNFPNFPSRNRQTREDFLLPLTLRREGSGEQLFTCCQDFLLPWVRQLDFELKKLSARFSRRFHSGWKSCIFFYLFECTNSSTFGLVIPYDKASLSCLLLERCQRGRPLWVQRVAHRNTTRARYKGWISQLCLEWRVAYR